MKKVIVLAIAAILLAAAPTPRVLKLATTTSAQSSGILDYLLPLFEAKNNVKVQVIAEGTGKALKTAEDGNADLVLVHAVKLEEEFVAQGFGVKRIPIMRNDFILVGPASDPAGIKGKNGVESFQLIKDKGALFISRSDQSGTYIKEMEMWGYVGGAPTKNRLEIGQGMEQALRMADEKSAYTLTDRATYLALRKSLKLGPLNGPCPLFENIYSVIATNPAKWPSVNNKDAQALIDWLSGPEGQKAIAAFAIDGEHPFTPIAGK